MGMRRSVLSIALLWMLLGPAVAADHQAPVRLIFDTDIGNDVDDVLALGVIHALQSRGECELLAVTITKDHEQCAPFTDAVNTFYGRGNIPIGIVRGGVTPEPSRFTTLAAQRDAGKLRYPHDLRSASEAPEAVELLRRTLAAQPDHSVVIVQVGFSTNLARLLDSPPDALSALPGEALVERKVRLLSIMAGAFAAIGGQTHHEYNVVKDIPAAQRLVQKWPTPMVFSGFEVGLAIPYPAQSIQRDFNYVAHHPLAEAYWLYMPPPHERPTWDLTSVLYAVRPEHGYFDLSPSGTVEVNDRGATQFTPATDGRARFLSASPEQIIRVREALAQLASQPPAASDDHSARSAD